MAKKVGVLAALLAVMLLAVSARTTITTTVVEDEAESRQQGSCQEQVREQDNFNMCQRFLREHAQEQGSSYYYYDQVAMVTEEEKPRQQKGESLRECCRQIENVREECRCEGLSTMMKHQKKQQRGQKQQAMERMMAEKLPAMCDLTPRQCQIESAVF